jgi:hypothetical protein
MPSSAKKLDVASAPQAEVVQTIMCLSRNDLHIQAHACKDWPAKPDPDVSETSE